MDLFVTDMLSDMTDAQSESGQAKLATVFEKQKSDHLVFG